MTPSPFINTLKIAKRLESVGVPLKQAEEEAEILAEVFEINFRNLATKDDVLVARESLLQKIDGLHRNLSNVEKDLIEMVHRSELVALEKRIHTRFERMETRFGNLQNDLVVAKLGGLMVALFTIAIGIIGFMVHK